MIKFSTSFQKIGLAILTAVVLLGSTPAQASVYSDREAANKQLEQQKAALSQTRQQVNTLEGQLSALERSISDLQGKITQTNSEIKSVANEVAIQEDKLKEFKAQNNELVRSAYQQGDTSTLEMLAQSDSLSDFVNKAQYLISTRQKITEVTAEIRSLKKSLDDKKTSLENNRRELEGSQQAISVERQKQSELLATTKGQESEYQAQVKETTAKKTALDSQIAALSRPRSGGSSATASGSVKRGQVIGSEGTTGNSSGCHLHFTVYQNGKEVNPASLISSGIMGKPSNYGPGNITQPYGPATWSNPWYSFHNGMDIATGCGKPIYAAADGDIVKNVRNDGTGYGHYIVINHNNGYVSLYAHMQ